MKNFYKFLSFVIFPILLVNGIAISYKIIMCHLANYSNDASFICELNWKDGCFLVCSYTIVKLIGPFLGFETITNRIVVTVGLYCFAYAIFAWPFLLASFFEPFLVNTFFHGTILILIIELVFSRFGYYHSKYNEIKK